MAFGTKAASLWREEAAPWLREERRKRLLRQLREAGSMWRTYRYPPLQYWRSRLYRDDERDAAGYVPVGVPMRFRHALNKKVDASPVQDKRVFGRLMAGNGLRSVAEILTTDGTDGIRTGAGRETTRAEAEAILARQEEVFVKPVDALSGIGAFVWRRGEPTDPIFQGRAKLVQPVVRQCAALSAMHPASINTIRIDTLLADGAVRSSMAVLRIGRHGECTDNTSRGGIFAPIDLETGRVSGPAVHAVQTDPALAPHAVHPDTGAPIEGVEIPFWAEVRAAVEAGARRLAPVRTLGWDVAVAPDGPVLIEANHRWYMAPIQTVLPLADTPLGRAARAYHLTGRLPPA
jgi:hypothetical protein